MQHITLGRIAGEEWRRAWTAIRAYAKARYTFRQEQFQQQKLLYGNDNKVGIAGEYWAMWYYQTKLRRKLVDRPSASNNRGYDFRYGPELEPVKVSVKTVTKENRRGKTMPLKGCEWDELCVILLKCDLRPYRVAVASHKCYEAALAKKRVTEREPVSRAWLEKGGWLHGKAKDWR